VQSLVETQPATLAQSCYFAAETRPSQPPTRKPYDDDYALPSNGEFVALLNAYRDLGGLARGQEVASMTVNRCGFSVRALASWILERRLLSFEWQCQIWIPLFQFDRATMVPLTGLAEVLAALSQSFAMWEQAHWFTQANNWLGARTPASVLPVNHEAVAYAARADMLIAAG
jgi:hypothetical protein